ncbi:FAD-dependent oxidoreductase [Neorhizobium sp. NCHU2750]|uniref:NAD(P)/FAD-dependent oxidoreductase n=1 Tax=Neorhizobium sp. NCHU2750 TaxID=1825976 RepID=UPI000E773023|nr:sarcosine oxidase beta subunit [Neorhizobium sp. NCHU2750]
MKVDVAIIGGGLVGCSAALALKNKGLSVALLERGFCGAQASGVNYGGVRRQGRPTHQLPLAQRAHAIWPKLQQLIGIDGEFRRTGQLKLARSEAEMASLEDYARVAATSDLKLELLGANALAERFPWIDRSIVVGASFSADDGQANPRLVSAGFAAAARRAGVQVFEQTPVLGVSKEQDGFLVEAQGMPQIRAAHLINAAGAWAGPFADAFGEGVPLGRIYPSMIVTEPMKVFMTVNTGVEGGNVYARQVERGNCIIGGQRGLARADNEDFSRPTAEGVSVVMQRAAQLFPSLKHAHAIRFWSGTEGAMPDKNPVIGASSTTAGLIHAFGFSGAGFQIAPGVGEVIAELVTDGKATTPIDSFAITRFSVGAAQGSGAGALQESLEPRGT